MVRFSPGLLSSAIVAAADIGVEVAAIVDKTVKTAILNASAKAKAATSGACVIVSTVGAVSTVAPNICFFVKKQFDVHGAKFQRILQEIYDEFAAQRVGRYQSSAANRREERVQRIVSSFHIASSDTDRSAGSTRSGPAAEGNDDEEEGPGRKPAANRNEQYCLCCNSDTLVAAGKGHLLCLRYAIVHGSPIHADACTVAAAGNFVACLDLLRKNDAPWSAEVTCAAALYGNFDALSYLLENGCAYDDHLLQSAARGGNLSCVRYLAEEVALQLDAAIFGAAFEHVHPECVHYLLEIGCPYAEYTFRSEKEWYIYCEYHNVEDVDERMLACIRSAVDRSWCCSSGTFECPDLVGYILRHPTTFPLCRALIIDERW